MFSHWLCKHEKRCVKCSAVLVKTNDPVKVSVKRRRVDMSAACLMTFSTAALLATRRFTRHPLLPKLTRTI